MIWLKDTDKVRTKTTVPFESLWTSLECNGTRAERLFLFDGAHAGAAPPRITLYHTFKKKSSKNNVKIAQNFIPKFVYIAYCSLSMGMLLYNCQEGNRKTLSSKSLCEKVLR